ncbi:MAG: tyrosine-type recombinase/integrase [Rhodospirillales bacterium]|nr:tyrosine-type recombinase/integrase [Rhodospirillales bacterium]
MRVVSEGPTRITRATVQAAWQRRAPGQRLIVRDAECRALALVVNATAMRWETSYRLRGVDPATGRRWPNRTVSLGNPGAMAPEAARAAANAIKGDVLAGRDPHAERAAEAQRAAIARSGTLGRLLDSYRKALPRRPKMRGTGLPSARHVREELAHCAAALDAMGAKDLPASELTAQHVRRMLDALGDVPATARARFGAFSRFMDWLLDGRHVPSNPCSAIAKARRPRGPASRSHYLTPAELARLWRAADELPAFGRDLARFLIAVPCRRGEAANMDWAHLDLAAGVWSQPGALTKNDEPHRLHLHPLAVALLRARHEAAGGPATGLVFPGPAAGNVFDGFARLKAKLGALAGITDWRWHDLRRSFASALGEAGIAEAVADAVLNHRQAATRGGVLGVYQRATRWPEQVAAMTAWGAMLAEAMGEAPPKVVALPMRRQA